MAPLNSYFIIFFFFLKTQSVNNNIFKLKIKKNVHAYKTMYR